MLPADFTPLYAPKPPSAQSCLFAFVGDDIVLTPDNALPTAAQLAALPAPFTDCLIGQIGDMPCHLQGWPDAQPVPEGLQRHYLRATWGGLNEAQYAIAVRAKLLLSWDREHRFCGICGTPTQPLPSEPARVCPSCRHHAYPRQSAAVMVLIRRGNELLLARSPHFSAGTYSALAGFVEAGETLEACVHREVMEEVGVKVTNLRWFGSRPWPFPHSLMLAFTADYVEGEITPQPGEIEDAQWFALDNLPKLPHPASLAYSLIQSAIPSAEGAQ